MKLLNKDRDVINIVNKVNILEAKVQEIETIVIDNISQRNNQLSNSNSNDKKYGSQMSSQKMKEESFKIIHEETKSVNMSEQEILNSSKLVIHNKREVKAINQIGKTLSYFPL